MGRTCLAGYESRGGEMNSLNVDNTAMKLFVLMNEWEVSGWGRIHKVWKISVKVSNFRYIWKSQADSVRVKYFGFEEVKVSKSWKICKHIL